MQFYKLTIKDDEGIHTTYTRDKRNEEEIIEEARNYILSCYPSFISYELVPVSVSEYNKASLLQGSFKKKQTKKR